MSRQWIWQDVQENGVEQVSKTKRGWVRAQTSTGSRGQAGETEESDGTGRQKKEETLAGNRCGVEGGTNETFNLNKMQVYC